MSILDTHLQQIARSIAHLSSSPSAIARDAVLDELRKCYDAVLSMKLSEAVVEVPVPQQPVIAAPPVQVKVVEEAAPVAEAVGEQEVEADEPVHEAPDNGTIDGAVGEKTVIDNDEPLQEVAADGTDTVAAEETVPGPVRRPLLGKAEAKPDNEAILAGRFNRKPITDLSSGIPLNEKFGIIRNLFAGNASDFGDAVLKLNNSKSASELKHYFQLLTQRRDWDMENESYQIFLGYVERKAGSLQPSEANTDH